MSIAGYEAEWTKNMQQKIQLNMKMEQNMKDFNRSVFSLAHLYLGGPLEFSLQSGKHELSLADQCRGRSHRQDYPTM